MNKNVWLSIFIEGTNIGEQSGWDVKSDLWIA